VLAVAEKAERKLSGVEKTSSKRMVSAGKAVVKNANTAKANAKKQQGAAGKTVAKATGAVRKQATNAKVAAGKRASAAKRSATIARKKISA
jgi:hypothetical protein